MNYPHYPRLFQLTLLTCLLISGCEPARRPAASDDDALYIPVEPITRPQLDSIVAANAGKVILIDFWATWCDPCLKEFPHTVSLNKIYGVDGLKVIAISIDEPENLEAVSDFLRISRAEFDNYISVYGSDEESIKEFEIEGGGIPYVQLYDHKGRLRYKYSGPTTNIGSRIEELLAELGSTSE